MSKSVIRNQNKSTADILVRFFDFYCRDFNFFDHIVNISGDGPMFASKSEDVQRLFSERFLKKELHPKFDLFLIRDPFNNNYNAAKNFKMTTQD